MKADFKSQMDQATVDAADQKAQFSTQMAQATVDAADQKAQFSTQMAQANFDAGTQKVSEEQFNALYHTIYLSTLFPQSTFYRLHLTSWSMSTLV